MMNTQRDFTFIQFLRGKTQEGADYHVFIRMQPDRIPALKRAIQYEPAVDYTEFGDVIAKGYGTHPSRETLEFIVRQYKGFLN